MSLLPSIRPTFYKIQFYIRCSLGLQANNLILTITYSRLHDKLHDVSGFNYLLYIWNIQAALEKYFKENWEIEVQFQNKKKRKVRV